MGRQGNCIAMAKYLQSKLKKFKIKSVLIPASVPVKYQSPGYIHLSHCALIIFDSENNIFLCDPAFYFNESAWLNFNDIPERTIYSNNIHNNTSLLTTFNLKYQPNSITFNDY